MTTRIREQQSRFLLGRLASAHTRTAQALSWEDGGEDGLDVYTTYTRELLLRRYREQYHEEIGNRAAERILLRTVGGYLLRTCSIHLTLIVAMTLAFRAAPRWYYGALLGAGLLGLGLFALQRNRRAASRLAERILQQQGLILQGGELRRILLRNLSTMPAGALVAEAWKAELQCVLPADEWERELMLKLAEEYDGMLADLQQTARYLLTT